MKLPVWLSRLLDPLLRARRDRRLDEEMRLHLELLTEEFEASGLSREDALLAARREFGGTDQVRMSYGDQRGFPVVQALLQDLAFAWRLFLRDRTVSVGIVTALALGIGSSVTVFTILNAMLLRDVPFFHQPDRVMAIDTLDARGRQQAVSLADLSDWQQAETLAGVSAYTRTSATLADGTGPAERVDGVYVSAGTFELLGAAPQLGRSIARGDDHSGAAKVAVLSHELWTSRYGGMPDIIGRPIRIDGAPATIVGVMPPGFTFPLTGQMWLPLAHMPGVRADTRDARTLGAVARLADNVTLTSARAELETLAAGLALQYPATNEGVRPVMVPFASRYLGTFTTPEPLLLLTSAILLLVVACVNASTLLLTRAATRGHEIALRSVMGASRRRIVAQLLTESVALASLAGVGGFVLATFAVRAFASTTTNLGLPPWTRFTMDLNVFAFIAAICLGAGIAFGCAPALQLSRTATPLAIKDGGRSIAGTAGTGRLMRGLLSVQVAVAVVLLAGAVTIAGRAREVERADLIVQPAGVLTARLPLPANALDNPDARDRFVATLLERMSATPGVTAASVSTTLPFVGAPSATLEREGDREPDAGPSVCTVGASAGYFDTLALPMLAGRLPGPAEREAVIVNEAFVSGPGVRQNVVGQRIRLHRPPAGASTPWLTIVGVVPSVRQTPMGDARACVYLPFALEPGANLALMLRTSGHAPSLAPDLRHVVNALDSDLAVSNVLTLEELSYTVRWTTRTISQVLSIFGLVAFVLSMMGVYAVAASGVAHRTREIGIRLALGAARHHIVRLVAGRVTPALAAGLMLGIAGGTGVIQLLRGVLVGQNNGSLTPLLVIAAAVVGIVVLACSVPVRRALRIDPAHTLRAE